MRLKPIDILKVLVSLALIAYLLWRVDLGAVSEAMRGASVPLLVLGAADLLWGDRHEYSQVGGVAPRPGGGRTLP